MTVEQNDGPQGDVSKIEKFTVSAGHTIFTQGEPGDAAFLLDSGQVRIFQSINGRRIEIGTVKKGDIFGEMAVIDGGRRMASAVTVTECKLSRIPASAFEKKLATSDRFIKALLTVFLRHLRGNHNTFLKRPRSFRDKVEVLDEVAEYIGFFAEKLEGEHAATLNAKLTTLRTVLDDLKALSDVLPDKRRNTILATGESFASVVSNKAD